MDVIINGETKSVSDGISLRAMLEHSGFSDTRGMAVAVNDKIVFKNKWDEFKLSDQDKVLLIKATPGG
ncbi:MAG: sulfur carrier protein ThiS [Bacteroidales bacterium]|jgi:sulfur carrier protein|nr:sulfur carrier protein ThiS [Bacteroidales bacterium]